MSFRGFGDQFRRKAHLALPAAQEYRDWSVTPRLKQLELKICASRCRQPFNLANCIHLQPILQIHIGCGRAGGGVFWQLLKVEELMRLLGIC